MVPENQDLRIGRHYKVFYNLHQLITCLIVIINEVNSHNERQDADHRGDELRIMRG